MPVISAAESQSDRGSFNAATILWEGCANGDTGSPVEVSGKEVQSVQVTGTFGSGGTVVLQGSNDGTNYVTLLDEDGSAISLTGAGLVGVRSRAKFVRPSVTAGDGTTDLDVTLLVAGRR